MRSNNVDEFFRAFAVAKGRRLIRTFFSYAARSLHVLVPGNRIPGTHCLIDLASLLQHPQSPAAQEGGGMLSEVSSRQVIDGRRRFSSALRQESEPGASRGSRGGAGGGGGAGVPSRPEV
jgi:hypothetical protein